MAHQKNLPEAIRAAEHSFRVLARLAQSGQSTLVLCEIDTPLAFEFLSEMRHQSTVEIATPQMCVAGGGHDSSDPTARDRQHRHIERAATEVEHEHVLRARLKSKTCRRVEC